MYSYKGTVNIHAKVIHSWTNNNVIIVCYDDVSIALPS